MMTPPVSCDSDTPPPTHTSQATINILQPHGDTLWRRSTVFIYRVVASGGWSNMKGARGPHEVRGLHPSLGLDSGERWGRGAIKGVRLVDRELRGSRGRWKDSCLETSTALPGALPLEPATLNVSTCCPPCRVSSPWGPRK